CPLKAQKATDIFQTIRVGRKIEVWMDHRQHVRRSLQNRIDSRMEAFRQSGLHPSEGDDFVVSEMQYPTTSHPPNPFAKPSQSSGCSFAATSKSAPSDG